MPVVVELANMVVTSLDDVASPLDPLDREAHAWVRRLTSGEATERDADALRLWCAQSPAHAAAFAAASRLWDNFGPAGETFPERRDRAADRPAVPSRRLVIGGALAASAAGVMMVRPPLGLWPSLSELRADYRTGTGQQRRIVVTNGVAIQMNTRTSIVVGSPGRDNSVELIGGEASISLPADDGRPFTLLAAQGRIVARKARFDVRVRDTSVSVTCMENEVVVEHGEQSIRLGSRHQISYGEDGLGPLASIDPAVVAAWQDGFLIFRMTPLGDVIEELNRYRPGRILLLNAALAHSPVNGRFRIDRTEDVLVQIERAFGVGRRNLPGGVVLLS